MFIEETGGGKTEANKQKRPTVDKDSKSEKVQVFLSTAGIPTDVRVAFGQQHGTALKSTACQIFHHLERFRDEKYGRHFLFFFFVFVVLSRMCSVSTISRSCSWRANASSLLSMQEAAATSRGVEPRIP